MIPKLEKYRQMPQDCQRGVYSASRQFLPIRNCFERFFIFDGHFSLEVRDQSGEAFGVDFDGVLAYIPT